VPSQLIDKLKVQFTPNQLFSLDQIKEKKLTRAALKESLLRLTKNGSVKRFGYGLYYLPGEQINAPLQSQAIEIRYIASQEDVYGFYTGANFLDGIIGKRPDPVKPLEIMTNKATSGKKSIFVFSRRITLRKPYFTINKKNVFLNSFLSYVSLSTLEEINQNYSLLANYIRTNQLSANDVMRLATYFPAKTSTKLLASDLYRSLWKH
jgi:hypothetical protein